MSFFFSGLQCRINNGKLLHSRFFAMLVYFAGLQGHGGGVGCLPLLRSLALQWPPPGPHWRTVLQTSASRTLRKYSSACTREYTCAPVHFLPEVGQRSIFDQISLFGYSDAQVCIWFRKFRAVLQKLWALTKTTHLHQDRVVLPLGTAK